MIFVRQVIFELAVFVRFLIKITSGQRGQNTSYGAAPEKDEISGLNQRVLGCAIAGMPAGSKSLGRRFANGRVREGAENSG
jgi:hypothetical protein